MVISCVLKKSKLKTNKTTETVKWEKKCSPQDGRWCSFRDNCRNVLLQTNNLIPTGANQEASARTTFPQCKKCLIPAKVAYLPNWCVGNLCNSVLHPLVQNRLDIPHISSPLETQANTTMGQQKCRQSAPRQESLEKQTLPPGV